MRRAFLLLLPAVFAGCVTPAPAPPAPVIVTIPEVHKPTQADELATYLASIRKLDAPGLAAEAARQREASRREASTLASLRLALALALAPSSEEGEILALVSPMTADGAAIDESARAMAGFLQEIAGERRRLKESAEAASVRAREDKRAYDAQKARADALQDRNAQLQKKLDALLSLEKSLSNRKTQGK